MSKIARRIFCPLLAFGSTNLALAQEAAVAGKWHRETLLEADRFLASIGYLPTPPTASRQ
jgi:hypothetical protein